MFLIKYVFEISGKLGIRLNSGPCPSNDGTDNRLLATMQLNFKMSAYD